MFLWVGKPGFLGGVKGGFRSLVRVSCYKLTNLMLERLSLARNLNWIRTGLSELAALGHLLLAIEKQWCAMAKSLSGDCSALLTLCFANC